MNWRPRPGVFLQLYHTSKALHVQGLKKIAAGEWSTWQLVAERAVASTRLLARMLCVICGGHYYPTSSANGGSTRTAEGAGARARDGSWAHVRERMLPACGAHVYDARDRSGGMRYASDRVGLASNHGPSKL